LRHAQELGLRIAPHLRNLVESYFTVFLGSSLDEVEREFIRRTIALADGNKARASEMLGVPRRTLYGKLERYDARHKSQRERVPPFERRTPGYMLRDLADIHNREGRSIDEIAEQLEAEPDEVRTWLQQAAAKRHILEDPFPHYCALDGQYIPPGTEHVRQVDRYYHVECARKLMSGG
jgi:hypothetical protein